MSDDRSPVDGWFREDPDVPPQRAAGYSADDMPTQVGGMPVVPDAQGGYPGPAAPVRGQGPDYQKAPDQGPQYQSPQYGRGYGGAADAYGGGNVFGAPPPPPVSQTPQSPPLPQSQRPVQPASFPEPYGVDPRQQPTQYQPRYEPYQQPQQGGGDGYGEPAQRSAYMPDYGREPEPHAQSADRNRTPLIAGTAVIGVAVLGLVGYLVFGGGPGKSGNTAAGGKGASAAPSPTHTSFQPTSADPATAAEQTGSAFLTAWQSGNLEQAAKYTDDPTAALQAMNDYKSGLNLSSLKVTPQPAVVAGSSPTVSAGPGAGNPSSSADSSAAGASAGAGPSGTVPFAATATVSLSTKGATALPWTYNSSLVAYKQSDGWSVKWSPAILDPHLTSGQKLKTVSVPAGVGKVTDAKGSKLSGYSETALGNISSALSAKAPTGHGTAGVAIERVDSSGSAVSGSKSTLKKPVDDSSLKTTIDPSVQAAATAAVAMNPRSAMVVLRPSTGAILAVANSAGSGDKALIGGLAPGSTFKVVTSAALFNYSVVQLNSPVACPLTFTVQGVVYHNSTDSNGQNEESLPAGTPFATDFAQSCNNAFTQFYKQLEGGKLAHTASAYFGL
ncbi:MAG: penicillin-binding transpeptidase domain-containing protein, partial [Actinocrinis sp.]